jgi:hypothetical protein
MEKARTQLPHEQHGTALIDPSTLQTMAAHLHVQSRAHFLCLSAVLAASHYKGCMYLQPPATHQHGAAAPCCSAFPAMTNP